MELIPIACHHCGAPLDVPLQAEIVTCQHCRTRLAVHRNESVAWTERINRIDERTEALCRSTARLEARLARVENNRTPTRLDQRLEAERSIREQGDFEELFTGSGAAALTVLAVGSIFGGAMMTADESLGITIWLLAAACAGLVAWIGTRQEDQSQPAKQRHRSARAAQHREYIEQNSYEALASGKLVTHPRVRF